MSQKIKSYGMFMWIISIFIAWVIEMRFIASIVIEKEIIAFLSRQLLVLLVLCGGWGVKLFAMGFSVIVKSNEIKIKDRETNQNSIKI